MEAKTRDELVAFFMKFGVLISNGVGLLKVMEQLEKESDNAELKQFAKEMAEIMQAGTSIVPAFEKYPQLFNDTIIKYIKIGEDTGTLDLALQIIPQYLIFNLLKQSNKK